MTGIIGFFSTNLQNKQTNISSSLDTFKSRFRKSEAFKMVTEVECVFGQQGSNLIDNPSVVRNNIYSKEESVFLTFDGEIYNQDEIKLLLRKEGVSTDFSTTEELILQSFLTWKTDCVQYFNGEFAFAIYDKTIGSIYLFRDRIGIKPLYYVSQTDGLYFSTEIESLLPFIDKNNWNDTAIQYYFRLGYIPAPFTIYDEMMKLEEGAFLAVDTMRFQPKIEKYWTPEEKITKEVLTDEKEAKKQLQELLISSVNLRKNTTHSFGTLLSGGIDSSLVTSIAQSLSNSPISTFSIGFEEASHGDSKYAKEVAKTLGTNHSEFILTHKEAQEILPEIPNWYSQPYADSSAIPTYLVAKKAGEKVKMVFSGDGGDEQFMGYGMYTWAIRLKAFKNSRQFYKFLLNLSPKVNHKRVAQYFDFATNDSVPMHIFSVDQGFFSAKQLQSYFQFQEKKLPFSLEKTKRKLLVSEEQALFDLKYYLPGDLTVKVDKAMLQNDVESRVPLLDHRIVEWSLNLDQRLKIKNGDAKYLLKQVLFEYLPESMFNRPKWGFGIPLGQWMNSSLRFLLEEYVSAEVLKQFPFYNVSSILEMKKQFLNGKIYLYNKLWLIIVFNMWALNKK